MTARSKTSPQLPPGLSAAEEAQWWDVHRDYWDTVDARDERLDPSPVRRTKPINLRLPVEMIDVLKREAARRALPYQALIRMWLKERLDAEAQERSRERDLHRVQAE
jgi:predicted DNA binding CopG/RHH family protein